MSAPRTNVERQKARHRAPLIGIALSLVFAALIFIAYLAYEVGGGTSPEDTGPQVEVTPGLGATLEPEGN